MIYNLTKKFDDKYMSSRISTFFDYDDTWTFISKDENATIYKENSELLCIICRKVISDDLCDIAEDSFKKAGMMVTTNRGIAAGQKSRIKKNNYDQGLSVNSSIVGYIDSANHKRPCRLTQFTKNNEEKFINALPFINRVDELFKNNVYDKYLKQYNRAKLNEYHIHDTSFSTITVNYNFRTALHKDVGDFLDGFGNITVCNKNIEGGHLLFPQYKLAIELDKGDYCALNVHEWHCNSEIIYNTGDAYRLSFVFYLRDKLNKCGKVNNILNKLLGPLSGKKWNTEILFDDIFKANGAPIKVKTGEKSWTMTSDRYILEYKNKRYKMIDKMKNTIIYNLMEAWEYSQEESKNHLQFQVDGD